MITIVDVSQYKGKCWKVELDDGEPLFLHCEIVAEYSLKKGINLPESAIEQIMHSSEVRRARERALYLLDMKDYSYAELLKKLEQNYSEETCFEVMDIMVETGVVNDYNYTRNLAENLVMSKRHGYYRARQEMRQKGLTNGIIEEVLSEYSDKFEDNLRTVIEYKYARYLTDDKGINKVKSALVRLGYSYEEINSVLPDYIDYE